MPELKRVFTSGRMNKDLDVRLIPNGEYRDAQNIEIATSEGSDVGSIQNISGTTIREARIWDSITNSASLNWDDKFGLTTLKCVGSIVDNKENKIYWFLHGVASDSTKYDLIMEYDEATNSTAPILIDKYRSDINSTILNFSTTTIITGINIIDGWLFWTDNNTEPKQLEISKWKINSSPGSQVWTSITQWPGSTKFPDATAVGAVVFEEEHITVIKKSPLKAPTVTASTTKRDVSINLNGVDSPNSTGLGTNPAYVDFNFVGGPDAPYVSNTDIVGFTFSHAPNWKSGDEVEFKHVLVDPSNVLTIFIFIGRVVNITGVRATINFMNIPTNITSLGDNSVEWEVTLVEDDPMWELKFPRFAYRWKYENGQYSCYSPFTEVVFIPSNFQYLSSNGHNLGMTNNIRRVKLSDFDDKPLDVVEVDILYKESNNNLVHIVDTLKVNHEGFSDNEEEFQLEDHEIFGAIVPEIQLLRPWDNVPKKALAQEVTGNRLVYGNYTQNYDIENPETPVLNVGIELKEPVYLRDVGFGEASSLLEELELPIDPLTHNFDAYPIIPKPSLKSIRTYQVGIAYLDKYGRQSPVLTSSTASRNLVKDPYSCKTTSLTVQADHSPPSWATHFKYYVKEVSGEYYNLSMDRFYMAEDNNCWLSFPSSERNKLDEESFIMLKKGHNSDACVKDRAKYKVLQIENEAPDFIAQSIAYTAEANVKYRGVSPNFNDRPTVGSIMFGFVGPSNLEHSKFAEAFSDDGFVQIKSAGNVSRKYEIQEGGLTGELENLSGNVNTHENNSVYEVTLKTPIVDTDLWVDAMEEDDFRIVVYQKKDKFLPEFEGRFFVKIERDAVIDKYIIASSDILPNPGRIAMQNINPNIYNYTRDVDTNGDPNETYLEEAYAHDNRHSKGEGNWIRPRHPKNYQLGYNEIFAGWKDLYAKRPSGHINSSGDFVEGVKVGNIKNHNCTTHGGCYSFHPKAGDTHMKIFVSPFTASRFDGDYDPWDDIFHSQTTVDEGIPRNKPINTFFDKLSTGALIRFWGATSATDTTRKHGAVYVVTNCIRTFKRRGFNHPEDSRDARVVFNVDFHLYGEHESRGYEDSFFVNGTAGHPNNYGSQHHSTYIDQIEIVQFESTATHETLSSLKPAIWETEPRETVDLDIYREASDAYPIDRTSAATIASTHGAVKILPYHNCFSFGNGVESNRIRDDFNQVVLDKGPKASTIIGEQYKEENRKSGLIFSGIFNSTNGVNRLNQFVMAENITKDVNPEYGSIQKLHSRNTDLITFCEDKVIRMLANKDALYNADGNVQLTASNNVLGQAVPYIGEYGIAKNPESFASHAYRVYFTDKARGAVLRLSRDGLTNIAEKGMTSWFRDNLTTSTLFVGSYDEKKGFYNLSLSDKTVSFDEKVGGWTSFKTFVPERGFSLNNKYYTIKNGNLYSHDSDTRNTFYGDFDNSTISLVFNDAPSVVKGFQTLNYDGTQARTHTYVTGTIGLDADGAYNTSGHSKTEKNKGWYSSSITTDLQTGSITEFVDKEGRWYNYIKGETTTETNLDSKEFSVQGIGKYSELGAAPGGSAAVTKRNLTVKLVPLLEGYNTPLTYVTTTEYGPTDITIGGGVQSTIGDQVLKIQPLRGADIILDSWTVGTLPTGVESVVLTLVGDDVNATVHFDDGTPNTAYLMPNVDTILEIPVYSNIIGGAQPKGVSINGTFDVTITNAVQTQVMTSGVTGSVNATTYTASSGYDDQVDVSIFTKTFTANTSVFSSFTNKDYTFNQNTTDSDPGSGVIKFNSDSIGNPGSGSVTKIWVDDLDGDSTNHDSDFTTLAAATGTTKGYIKIAVNGSTTQFKQWKISDVTDKGGYWELTVHPTDHTGSLSPLGIYPGNSAVDVTLISNDPNDYYFNVPPTASVIVEDSNPSTKYNISTSHTTNGDGQIIATVFTIKYRFGANEDRFGDKIKFIANAVPIITETVEVRNMTIDNAGSINAVSLKGKPQRTIKISGHPDAVFTLTHNNGSSTVTLKTDQAIGAAGHYPMEVEFPHVTANTTHTFTLTSSQNQLVSPFPSVNPLVLYQYTDSTITWKFQSSTLGLTTSGGDTNTADVINAGSTYSLPSGNNINGDIDISWVVDTPASIPLKTYGTTPDGGAPLFTNIEPDGTQHASNKYSVEFNDITATLSSKGGGAPTGTRLTIAATGDIHQFGIGDVDSVLDIETFIKYNEAPIAQSQTNVAITNNTATTITAALTTASQSIQTAEGDTITYSLVGNDGGATKATVAINSSSGVITYTPDNASQTGADTITFKANDGHQDSANATIGVNIATATQTCYTIDVCTGGSPFTKYLATQQWCTGSGLVSEDVSSFLASAASGGKFIKYKTATGNVCSGSVVMAEMTTTTSTQTPTAYLFTKCTYTNCAADGETCE